MVVSTALLVGLRREVYNPSSPPKASMGNQDAMAVVEAARRKRNEARALAARDPMMARELGIGRPDIQRRYDDGGLLDLNLPTADQLTSVCQLPRTVADEVVAARASLGRFMSVDDALVFGQVGEGYSAIVRDRGIVITDQ